MALLHSFIVLTLNAEQYRKARLNINNSTGAISRPSWKDYPSHWSKEKVKEHDLKHRDDIPAERAQYIHRGIYMDLVISVSAVALELTLMCFACRYSVFDF